MATRNFFDLLADDENEDPSQVVVRATPVATAAAVEAKPADKRKPAAPAKLPTKPASPAEAVKDGRRAQYDGARGGRGGYRGGRGYSGGREGGGPREGGDYRERGNYSNGRNGSITRNADGFVGGRDSYDRPIRTENGERRSYEGGRGGGNGRGGGGRGFGEGDEHRPRREFDRQSRGSRGGSVRGVSEESKRSNRAGSVEKTEQGEPVDAAEKEGTAEKKEEDNEMTLEQYEKVLEEKRKALEATKASERKVEMDKAFEKMQLVENKKREEDVFIKLGQEKEKIKRDAAEREEKSRKPVSINEFLKPAEGERFYYPSNRGRGGRGGRGDRRDGGDRHDSGYRGDRDSTRGSFGAERFGDGRGSAAGSAVTPKIEDQSQFPTLGGK
ncbi:RGG repeats nuclear RNA binding protein B [Physcomitrium patens]|uniref:Hyaluronan/mRNA-binding protein domain-containing protein n=1 Tax=Physcomitrium patens TaxID=3218 RepID=A0A2K1L3P5_PHYPA|nr:RGG repeats nuclear RNA binding protein B-like [Physcomitrium patens]PNR60644.1 hypothetical protein PHYPA_003437 [Physcomitrium patens]|eukprot:XP_024368678.1 RGG repeats nuclear RNA binding protein B-like [Physcomitrella patens]